MEGRRREGKREEEGGGERGEREEEKGKKDGREEEGNVVHTTSRAGEDY